MLPLFDMMARAQNGHGVEMLARQFNLSQQQAQLALEALLPAFSQGLKRNTSEPYGMSAFLGAMASGQHAQYFEDASRAFSPQGVQDGNGVLDQLFGSKDLSRAVAAQAAQATGLGQDLLRQMLPVVAAMMMGGLFKQSTGQMPGAERQGGNPLQDLVEQMMRQMGGGISGGAQPRPQAPQPGANPFDNPFGKALEGMFGGGRREDAPRAPQSPYGDNPLGRIFEEMMGGGRRTEPEPPPEPRPEPNPSGRPRNPYDDLFGNMFETGAKTRDDYQKTMESVFDQFKKGMERQG